MTTVALPKVAVPRLSVGGVVFSHHATERALDMAVDPLELQSALFSPDCVEFSSKHQSWNFVSGRVCCGVAEAEDGVFVVVTVLWRSREGWRADLSRGLYGGREARL